MSEPVIAELVSPPAEGGDPRGQEEEGQGQRLLAPQPEPRVLDKPEPRGVSVVRRIERLIRQRAERIVLDATYAADIDDEGPKPDPKPDDMSARRYRVARDARLSKRLRPGYIEDAQKTLESFRRLEAAHAQPQLQQLNIGAVNIVTAAVYPVKKLDDK